MKRTLGSVALTAMIGLLGALCAGRSGAALPDQSIQIQVGATKRTCWLHLPPAYDGARALPVIIGFHGSGGTGRGMSGLEGFTRVADQDGFIAAFPDGIIGTQHTWNSLFGHVPGGTGIASDDVDDIAFTRALIDTLRSRYHADPKRIYVCGFSSGAYMAYRVAVELGDRVAGACIVAGSLGIKLLDGKPSVPDIPRPVAPISILHIAGLLDHTVRYAGATTPRTVTKSVPDCIEYFVKADGCRTPGVQTRDQEHGITRTLYAGGREGTAAELITIDGLGHAWPTAAQGLSTLGEMWTFFSAHARTGR